MRKVIEVDPQVVRDALLAGRRLQVEVDYEGEITGLRVKVSLPDSGVKTRGY